MVPDPSTTISRLLPATLVRFSTIQPDPEIAAAAQPEQAHG
jgi:hypothetical protein